MARYHFAFILTLYFGTIQGQELEKLELLPSEESGISHTFKLYISKDDASKILSSSGKKVKPSNPILLYNGDTSNIKSLKTRGRSSLNFPRKSISVSLQNHLEIDGGEYKNLL